MDTKAIFRAAIGAEAEYACIGESSPLPDPDVHISTWLPFLHDGGQLADQIGDPELLGIQQMAGDFGGFADELDSLDRGDGEADFLYRVGTASVAVNPFSVPDFEESALFPSLLATPAGLLLGSAMAVRPAVTDRTVTVSASGAGEVTLDASSDDVVEGQLLGRDVNGRREATLVTAVDGVVIEHAGWQSAPAENDTLRLGQLFEATAHGSIGPSVGLRLDYRSGRDYCVGGRMTALSITASKRRVQLATTVDFPIIYSDRAAADVISGANVRGAIREPAGRRHATLAATYPRVVPHIHQIDAEPLAVNVAGELLAVDEVKLDATFELGSRGNFDGLGPGDRDLDNVSFTASLHLSKLPTDLALEALAAAHRNYHLFILPLGPTGAHGGAVAFYATVVSDLRKLDRSKPFQRVVLNLRSVSGPLGVCPLRISLF